jgi:hypothetical protein
MVLWLQHAFYKHHLTRHGIRHAKARRHQYPQPRLAQRPERHSGRRALHRAIVGLKQPPNFYTKWVVMREAQALESFIKYVAEKGLG